MKWGSLPKTNVQIRSLCMMKDMLRRLKLVVAKFHARVTSSTCPAWTWMDQPLGSELSRCRASSLVRHTRLQLYEQYEHKYKWRWTTGQSWKLYHIGVSIDNISCHLVCGSLKFFGSLHCSLLYIFFSLLNPISSVQARSRGSFASTPSFQYRRRPRGFERNN
jgi:hypothetical protein